MWAKVSFRYSANMRKRAPLTNTAARHFDEVRAVRIACAALVELA